MGISTDFGLMRDSLSLMGFILGEIGLNSVPSNVSDMFAVTSVGTGSFHDSAVVQMTINVMRGQENFQWDTPHGKKAARSMLFPNFDTSQVPSVLSIDGLSMSPLHDGGVALTAKCFYNGLRDYDDNIQSDKFNSGVSALNQYFNDHATALLAEYYRFHFRISPSSAMVQKYLQLLLSRAYRMQRATEISSGLAGDIGHEVFHHFAKLKACGASDGDITAAYTVLTTTDPIIDPAVLSGVTPSTWKANRSWLFSGNIDWSDMQAQQLGAIDVYVPPPVGQGVMWPVTFYFCEAYLKNCGYWKAKSSSSCFAGETLVVLGDGKTTRRIDEIKAGDLVYSRSFASGAAQRAAAVAFVSRVNRAGRSLHHLPEAPTVLFTSTHPLVRRQKDKDLGEVAMVDVDSACAHNPTWHSMPTVSLEDVKTLPARNSSDESQPLYDLILQPPGDEHGPSAEFATYILVDAKIGVQVEALSEAPHMPWFPHATCLLAGVLTSCEGDAKFISRLFDAFKSDTSRLAPVLRAACTDTFRALDLSYAPIGDKDRVEDDMVSLDTLLCLGDGSDEGRVRAQRRADLIEACVGRLGRLMNDAIHLGWAQPSDEDSVSQMEPYLLVRTLTYRRFPGDESGAEYPSHKHLQLVLNVAGTLVTETIVPVEAEGWGTFEIQQAIPLHADSPFSVRASGGSVASLDVSIMVADGDENHVPRESPAKRGTVAKLSKGVLVGGGSLLLDTAAFVGLTGPNLEATLNVCLVLLDPREVEKWQGGSPAIDAGAWNESVKMRFARSLGARFAKAIFALSP